MNQQFNITLLECEMHNLNSEFHRHLHGSYHKKNGIKSIPNYFLSLSEIINTFILCQSFFQYTLDEFIKILDIWTKRSLFIIYKNNVIF